jgi:hypothetical protein
MSVFLWEPLCLYVYYLVRSATSEASERSGKLLLKERFVCDRLSCVCCVLVVFGFFIVVIFL